MGVLLSRSEVNYEDISEATVEQFYKGDGMIMFDQTEYEGATVTSAEGTYDGLKVTVYTINGKVVGDFGKLNYDDYKVYVYNGYLLNNIGKINGKDEHVSMSIYFA